MRIRMPLAIAPILGLWTAGIAQAQITSNPIPEPIVKRGIAVEVKDFVRLPDTRETRSADQDVSAGNYARVSYVKDAPDGRRFANDSRGFLYIIDSNNQTRLYANIGAAFPNAIYKRLESGFIGFAFQARQDSRLHQRHIFLGERWMHRHIGENLPRAIEVGPRRRHRER